MIKRPGNLLIASAIAIAATTLATAQSALFFNEGWESGSLTGSFNSPQLGRLQDSAEWSLNNTIVGRSGTWALRHALSSGNNGDDTDVAGQHFADSPRTPVWPTRAGEHLYDLYIQYKFYYSPGFNFGSGHFKQFIVGTQDAKSSHTETCCFPPAAHYITLLVEHGGAFQTEGYNKQSTSSPRYDINPNSGGYNDSNPYIIQTGQWYTLEARRRLNDSGVDNGIFQLWINGVMVSNYTNVRYRVPINGSFGTDFTYGTNFMQVNDYTTQTMTQNQQVYYDDVKLSSSPIGAGNVPSAPTNLRIIPQ